VSTLNDVLYAVKQGVDTFDCILPTRDARAGILYTYKTGPHVLEDYDRIKIYRGDFSRDLSPIDAQCECYTCMNFSKAYIHHLFKQRELLGYRLMTIHNLTFIERFFKLIRSEILKGNL
jgi:queuine tRNA-ribosyltransferase